METYLKVGVITTTHGVRGEVKVFPTTDDPVRFKKLKKILLDTGKEKIELEIESVKFFKQMVILKFKGYDSINDIEKFKQKELFVSRLDAVSLKKDEFFIADLIDMDVCDEAGQKIGKLYDCLSTGANDVYVIKLDDGRELLLPAIKECVLEVNLEENFMKVHILEGLL